MHRLTLLGGFRLDGPEGPVTGSAARGRHAAVLALLARAGTGGMPRERITAMLWPDADAERARHSLEQVVYVLRRTLGPGAVITLGTDLVLDEQHVMSDAAELVAAAKKGDCERAVSLYRGPFLDAFHLSGAGDFERWADGERGELQAVHAGALLKLAEEQTAAGDHLAAAATWRRLTAEQPLSSAAVLGFMRSLDLAGDRAAAIGAARAHETLLREELDAAPDREILALAEQLRGSPLPAVAAPRDERVAPAATHGAAPAADDRASHQTARRWASRPRRLLAAGLVAMSAIAAIAIAIASAARGASPAAADPLPRVSVDEFSSEAADSVPEAAGRMAGDWIRQGLARTGLVTVASVAEGSPSDVTDASVRVSGRIYRSGDDLWFQAWMSRPETGAIISTMDPVRAPVDDPVAALEPLRQQVLGAAGVLFDPRLSEWSGAVLRPPTFEAYRQFVEGLEAFSTTRLPAAVLHFRRAAALDPAYAQPHLWGAWTCVRMHDLGCADSLAGAVEHLEASLTPLEQAWQERIQAVLSGDAEGSFRAAERMARINPGSGWEMALYNAAMDTRRVRLAAATLRSVGPDGLGLAGGYYWSALAEAHHALGEHRTELEVLDEGVREGSRTVETLAGLAAALAALGDTTRIRALVADATAAPGLSELDVAHVMFTAGIELRAHGNRRAAQPLLEAAADRYGRQPGPGDRRTVHSTLRALHEAGRWSQLEQFAAAAPLDEVDRIGVRGYVAARGERVAEAARASAELARLDGRFLFGRRHMWRARIAAAEGDAERAVALLQQAFAAGSGWEWRFLHQGRDFDSLRDRPGFQDLVRPRE